MPAPPTNDPQPPPQPGGLVAYRVGGGEFRVGDEVFVGTSGPHEPHPYLDDGVWLVRAVEAVPVPEVASARMEVQSTTTGHRLWVDPGSAFHVGRGRELKLYM